MIDVRPELPPMPTRIAMLPVHRGYPVPWFAAWTDDADPPNELPVGKGTPDFRIVRADAVAHAHNDRRCWICGKPRGVWLAFMGGPMCAITRTVSEPPSHLSCAQWAIRACPFLVRPHAKRRENALPEDAEMAGLAILRNPGAGYVWVARDYYPFSDGRGGVLFHMGEPDRVEWYAEGRPATRAEVEASIESGLPPLRELAEAQDGGVEMLELQLSVCRALLPEEGGRGGDDGRVSDPAAADASSLPLARSPYIGHGAEGCRASARIDRDEADTLAADDPRRADVLESAEQWGQAVTLDG